MAYDEDLADRIRQVVGGEAGVSERRMFGGHAFLIDGHLAVSASGRGGLLLRVDPADTDSHLAPPGVTRFEMRGRQPAGWLHVQPQVVRTRTQLAVWVGRGVAFARSLPPKQA